MSKLDTSDIPTGWMEKHAPVVSLGAEGYYWMWIVAEDLGAEGQLITLRKPEVVRVIGHENADQRHIARTTGKTVLPSKLYEAGPRSVALWKGPLHHG